MQDIVILVAVAAFFIASSLNLTAMVPVAMIGGTVGGVLAGRFCMTSRWNQISMVDCPVWKRYLIMAVVALVFSQIAWAALLV